ncbi:tyrosinase family oxidase copper chaperone [Streptomyces tuirus]|uniref:Tyrosinase n=1 Tax=Streptomyces tuirus TaxID=68278 RepID=A0A7G1NCL2_9ACTN|nr:tyrosinase family oxidase copper chaperone [Streptomyces tuirus]BCL20559.1 tyrosinase [Streptomyces tuirus]
MVVGVGGVPVGAAGDGVARGTRRGVLRGLMAAAAGAALVPVALAAWPEESDGKNTDVRAGDGMFEETYRGRLIRGVPIPSPEQEGGDDDWHVTVDGRPLHLMRRADGSWLSMVDHYRSYPTPLAATRAAVDELGPGQRLRDLPAHTPGHLDGGAHGVHA